MEPQATHTMGPSEGPQGTPLAPNQTPTSGPGSHEAASRAVEAAHAPQAPQFGAPPQASQPTQAQQYQQSNFGPGPQVGASPAATWAATASPTGSPAIADDSDLIEKEWVIKAKQVVEQTKADPYLQSKELNKIKAEYIKKRYNKEIKLPES